MSRDFCYRCHRAQSSCLCSFLQPIETQVHIVILIHPMERQKVKNGTGRMTHFQLSNSSMIYGIDFTHNKQVNTLLSDYNCALLYPGETSLNLSNLDSRADHDKIKKEIHNIDCLFLLDGTWPAAKKMLRLSSNLQRIPKLSFSNSIKSQFVIKQQPHELCLSTIESTKVLLDELKRLGKENDSLSTQDMLIPFQEMIRYQIQCIENPHNNTHHHVRKKHISKKDNYRKKGSRSIFYDS